MEVGGLVQYWINDSDTNHEDDLFGVGVGMAE